MSIDSSARPIREMTPAQTAATTTDQPPDKLWDYEGHVIRTWFDMPASGEVEHAVILTHGLRSNGLALAALGNEISNRNPNTVVVRFNQPVITPADTWRDVPRYWREANLGAVRKLRAGVLETVAAAALKEFLLDQDDKTNTVDMVSHSLSANDAAEVAARPRRFDVGTVTLMAPAGMVKPSERYKVASRALRAKCGPRGESQEGWLRDPHLIQHLSEYTYGLGNMEDRYIQATEHGSEMRAITFLKEAIWLPRVLPEVFKKVTTIKDGCACHFAPAHPQEAPRIAAAVTAMGFGRGHLAAANVSN